ncbi:MAG: rhodanese-like domain-containing protein [Acidimicrobiia bacterium]
MTRDTVPAVDAAEGHRRADGGALLLDVREQEEWEDGHAEGAVWIPMRLLSERAAELPGDREIVVICRSGHRSATVTSALIQGGFRAVNLAGGSLAWVAAGLPFVRDDGSPGSVA